MCFRRRLVGLRASLTLIIAGVAMPALAMTIDDFSVGPVVVSRVGPSAATAMQSGLDPAHVLGGGRDIVVGDSGSGDQSLAIDTAARELRFNIASGLGYFHITYGSAAQPLNVNLRAGGANSF